MAHTKILFRGAARDKVLRGATQLADAVRVTLGPKSKSVLIQRSWGAPLVCNDGVTIAKQVDLEDPEENLGAQMLRQAAERTGELVGDGTSTATVLAHALFADGVRNVVAGASAIDLKRGLDRGLQLAVDTLRSQSRPVSTRLEKAQVATISAHNDANVGEQVADALEKVGSEGGDQRRGIQDHRDCCGVWWKACASTGVTYRRTSSPTARRCRWCWRTPTCCSASRRSACSRT